MRATLGAIALALAAGLLGWVFGDRNKIINHPDPDIYQPALYSVHVRAVDEASKSPVEFRLGWDIEKVSGRVKGSEPATVQKFADGSVGAHVVGHFLDDGLAFEVVAEGYEAQTIQVKGSGSGIRTNHPDDVDTVELEKLPAGAAIQNPSNPVAPLPGR
ncbi:MAG: hypothetical protein EOP83_35520 [Verrucomicrobiaceae bacterium]|nr:MAG: hypothetical protein EOP83_35520 [Verrucomicrobiaceae bacterium]